VEGTHEGLDAARARGVRLGRPPALTPEQVRHARDLLTRPGNTVASIARLLRVSRSTLYKHIPELAGGSGQRRTDRDREATSPTLPHSSGLTQSQFVRWNGRSREVDLLPGRLTVPGRPRARCLALDSVPMFLTPRHGADFDGRVKWSLDADDLRELVGIALALPEVVPGGVEGVRDRVAALLGATARPPMWSEIAACWSDGAPMGHGVEPSRHRQ